MSIDNLVVSHLNILSERVEDKWHKSKYETVKVAPNTPKGDFGESVLSDLINTLTDTKSEIINGGKGEFDVLTDSGVKIECKLATEDTSGAFQFNGLKKDVDFDYAFGLGVSPNEMWFGIWSKDEVQNLTTPMTKDGSDSYKLSARKSERSKYRVIPLTEENFKREISKIV